MRFPSLLAKASLEGIRDWKMLSLAILFAPFFVAVMHAYLEQADDPHRVVVVNRDVGHEQLRAAGQSAGELLVETLRGAAQPGGRSLFEVQVSRDLAWARGRLRKGAVDLVLVLPPDLSAVLLAYQRGERPSPAVVRTYGSPRNASYLVATAWSDALTQQVAGSVTGLRGPVVVQAETSDGGRALSQYESYVPGLLALAVMMLMFTAAGALIREKDQKTLVRLRMSRMRIAEWLGAVSVVQAVLGVFAVGLTLLTAVALDYRAAGSLLALAVITVLSSLSIVAFGVIVAAALRTSFDLVTIGCFPFFLLMFFSGGIFPLPGVNLFELAGRTVHLNDVLPTTHTIGAYQRILDRGAGLGDLGFEMAALVLLTAALFALGAWWFTRRHLHAA